MKIEEAIETLEEKRKYCKMFYELSANPQEDYPSTAKFMNALELALTTMQSMPEAGEPLSLEQLKQMDGKPVWCEWLLEEDRKIQTGAWFIVVKRKNKYGFELKKPLDFGSFVCKNENYGREWLAYPYPPTHIDRRKWKCCLWCESLLYLPHEMCADIKMPGGSEIGARFCPSCGRPLTEEAWAELERRLRLPEPPEEG